MMFAFIASSHCCAWSDLLYVFHVIVIAGQGPYFCLFTTSLINFRNWRDSGFSVLVRTAIFGKSVKKGKNRYDNLTTCLMIKSTLPNP